MQIGDGVAGVGGYAQNWRVCRGEAALEFHREHEVGELRLRIGSKHGTVAALTLQIIECDLAEFACVAADGNDA